MRSTYLSFIALLLCAIVCWQCASEAAPGGGPPDKTPPALITSSIQSGETLVPIDQKISFMFSENLNTDLAKKSITVFPLSDNTSQIHVKGKSITVSPVTTWDPDVVYTIVLGKNIADYRGNGLPRPLQFSFTPGEIMPENRISGKINGLTQGSTAVISINRKISYPDSILLYPEFYTQSGPEGNFTFEHLPEDSFFIAAYVDLDKSNSFKATFDGICVPSQPVIVPDTSGKTLIFEAIYDNFLPGQLLKAESLQPTVTELTFQKNMAPWNNRDNFQIDSMNIDTLIYKDNICTLYHKEIETDTFLVELNQLLDHIGVPMADTSFHIPLTAWADSFYHFTSMKEDLFISPPPLSAELEGTFQTPNDTSALILSGSITGFYSLPTGKSARQGAWLVRIPEENNHIHISGDSLYSVPLEIKVPPDYGMVIGKIDDPVPQKLRLLLHNAQENYDIGINDTTITFDKVRPGSYTLSYYIDKNTNGRRDTGRPYPYIKPEILYDLDTGIDVRARWDTELSDPYKIVVENEE